MRLRTYIVDAFVVGGQPGTGNAAGVVLLPSIACDPALISPTSNDGAAEAAAAAAAAAPLALDDASRQRLAAELRQTETAFVERVKGQDGRDEGTFLLRWFTPTTEVPLCGHATLAAAAALVAEGVEGCCREEEEAARTAVYRFETVSSGLLTVRVRFPASSSSAAAAAPTFELDLPSRPPTDPPPRGFRVPPARQEGDADADADAEKPPQATTALLRALCGGGGGKGDGEGEEPSAALLLLLPRLRGISFNAELGYLVVELEPGGGGGGRELIEGLSPDPRALREAVSLAEGGRESGGDEPSSSSPVSGLIVTSLDPEEAESTMLSRFFGPWMGIDEDPATGSAHAVLAPLWDKELRRRRREEGRGGVAGVVAAENNAAEDNADDDGPLFWRARQLSARGGELSVCFQEDRERVLVAGGAAVALEGWAHV